jgi:hypothetical protein
MKTTLLAIVLAFGVATVQESTQPASKLEQHDWLQQLVGEWTLTSEAVVGPDTDPETWKSAETVRAIGDLWVVAEGTIDLDATPFTWIMTLGYDPSKGAFVGSWIDTMQPTMWSYVGHLDESKRILTLEAEGPSIEDPSKTGKYRDQIELLSSDHKRTTSSALGDDGTWTTFMTVDAHRVK